MEDLRNIDNFNAPWMFLDIDLLGRNEADTELAKRLVPFWKRLGLRFLDLIGTSHAWCALRVNYALDKVGIKGSGSAAASSFQAWGRPCPYWFGSVLPIQHANGKHHVCFFIAWIDEAKGIACTLDGNRNNQFGVFQTDISGKGDKVKPSPRWPVGHPDGMSPSLKEVLALYPFFGHAGVGESTR